MELLDNVRMEEQRWDLGQLTGVTGLTGSAEFSAGPT